MFAGSLYKIKSLEVSPEKSTAKSIIILNPGHEIFKGHFPGNPVLPGVCMIQIIKELVAEISGKTLMLVTGNTIKFQNPVVPEANKEITADFKLKQSEGIISVNAQISSANIVYSSFKGEFRVKT